MSATRLRSVGRAAVAVVAVSLALSACGGNSGKEAKSTNTSTSVAAPAAAFQAAPAGTTGRVIVIKALDTLKFDPSSVTVQRGETVTFRVENDGKMDHEFDVGDAAFQANHEKEMQQMPAGMEMGDEPTGFEIKAGQTKELTLTFTQPGTLIYACHQPGHYAAGMRGEIKVA